MPMDTTIITSLFGRNEFLSVPWFIPLIVIMVTLPIITRDTSKWKILAFPVSVMYMIAGMDVSLLILLISGFLFVQASLSFQALGQIVFGSVDKVPKIIKDISPYEMLKRTYEKRQAKRDWSKKHKDVVNLGIPKLKIIRPRAESIVKEATGKKYTKAEKEDFFKYY